MKNIATIKVRFLFEKINLYPYNYSYNIHLKCNNARSCSDLYYFYGDYDALSHKQTKTSIENCTFVIAFPLNSAFSRKSFPTMQGLSLYSKTTSRRRPADYRQQDHDQQ